jgi:MFS family permease
LEHTGSAAAMAMVLICLIAPTLVFLLIGGVAADRYPRVPLMLASDLIRGVILTVVALLAVSGALELWHIYLAAILAGTVDGFFQPAYIAMVPTVVPAEQLPSANALTSMSTTMGRIAGPAIGAVLIGVVGTAGAFAINGLSFFLAAALLLPLLGVHVSIEPETGGEGGSILQDVREGIATVVRVPILWIGILLFALTNVTLAGPYSITLPFLVKQHLKADVDTLGLLYAVFPIGYLLGGIWLGRLIRIRRRGLLSYAGLLTASIMLALFGLDVPIAVLILAALINGAALEVQSLIWTNTLQEIVPSERLGRVASIDQLGSYVLLPVGFAVTGWATTLLGPAPVFVLGGGITASLALLALAHPAVHRFD